MSRCKYTAEEKYEILKAYEDGKESIMKTISKFKISEYTFNCWKYKFKKYGIDGLNESRTWKRYSNELKELAVKDCLSGEYSSYEIVKKYEISGRSVLLNWVSMYNSHSKIKTTSKGISQAMTKGRTTSWEEKIEIVLYCIANDNDYKRASEVYNITYQQVYQWVRKYLSGNEDALKDRRGRTKVEVELTAEDSMKLAFKRLEIENEKLRAENAYLKKLEELERGRF